MVHTRIQINPTRRRRKTNAIKGHIVGLSNPKPPPRDGLHFSISADRNGSKSFQSAKTLAFPSGV
jgi:hypothetical protein